MSHYNDNIFTHKSLLSLVTGSGGLVLTSIMWPGVSCSLLGARLSLMIRCSWWPGATLSWRRFSGSEGVIMRCQVMSCSCYVMSCPLTSSCVCLRHVLHYLSLNPKRTQGCGHLLIVLWFIPLLLNHWSLNKYELQSQPVSPSNWCLGPLSTEQWVTSSSQCFSDRRVGVSWPLIGQLAAILGSNWLSPALCSLHVTISWKFRPCSTPARGKGWWNDPASMKTAECSWFLDKQMNFIATWLGLVCSDEY